MFRKDSSDSFEHRNEMFISIKALILGSLANYQLLNKKSASQSGAFQEELQSMTSSLS
jgi:hypothetical protein